MNAKNIGLLAIFVFVVGGFQSSSHAMNRMHKTGKPDVKAKTTKVLPKKGTAATRTTTLRGRRLLTTPTAAQGAEVPVAPVLAGGAGGVPVAPVLAAGAVAGAGVAPGMARGMTPHEAELQAKLTPRRATQERVLLEQRAERARSERKYAEELALAQNHMEQIDTEQLAVYIKNLKIRKSELVPELAILETSLTDARATKSSLKNDYLNQPMPYEIKQEIRELEDDIDALEPEYARAQHDANLVQAKLVAGESILRAEQMAPGRTRGPIHILTEKEQETFRGKGKGKIERKPFEGVQGKGPETWTGTKGSRQAAGE